MGKKGKRHSKGGNKKSKNRRESEEADDDNEVQVEGTKKCVHVLKAAKLGVLQNNIPHMKLRECSFCEKGQNEGAGICMCLGCGKQGCDRYSEDKHALSHHDSNTSHCLTVNLHSMMVWCYSCDMEVPVQPDTDLHKCIKLLLKALKMNAPNDQMPSMPNITHAEPMKKSEALNFKYALNANKIKGLVNLGNTCFFNSVMQNLFQTELLHVAMAFVNQSDYCQTITTKSDSSTLSVQVTTPPGSLITALTKLLYEYRSSSPGPLNPKFLFSEICKKAPRFRGFQQQDSQELLRYLLDSVKTEQLRRIKIGVLKAFEITEGTEVKSLPEKKKEKLKDYVSHVTAPSVDSVFAGRLDSIVLCHQCHKESRVTESFLDLSLSLAVPQYLKVRQKTPSVSQRNKKNASDREQDNKGEDENSTKPQTPSKHQQKAAREAKRKKGRKGKKRTVSHSISDDGKQETKQQDENLEATSDESDHEEPHEATEDVTTDQKNSGDSNMKSCAKDSGVEEEATKDKRVEDVTKDTGIEETKNSSEKKVPKDFGIQNPHTMNSGIEIDVAKDTGIGVKNMRNPGTQKEVTKNSGIDINVAKDSGMIEITAKDSEEESPLKNKGDLEVLDSECVTDSGFELKGGTGEETEETMETDAEKIFSGDQNGKGSNYTTDVVIDETKCLSLKRESLSDPLQNPGFHAKEHKELETGGKINLSDKINDGEQDLKSEEELNKEHSNFSNNVSHEDSRNTINDEIISNVTVEKNENQLNESGNFEEKKRQETDLSSLASDMETAAEKDKNLELFDKDSHSIRDNEGGTQQDEIALNNLCESCEKVDQSCELKKKDCGCLKNDNTKKKTSGTESAEDEEKIANSVINGIKELEMTDKENNILGENIKELGHKNVENNEQHPEMSPELKHNTEEKFASSEENFLPKVHTLRPAYSSLPGECSVQSCLSLFCSPEILEGKNKFACEECSKRKRRNDNEHDNEDEASSTDDDDDDDGNDDDDDDKSPKGATASKPKTKKEPKQSVVYTEATKQLLLSYTPPVLTLHFKRFQQVGFGLRKVAKHVDFPLVLDLAPFCRRNGEISSDSKQQVLYSLIGVVEHSGGLNSGHYTACVKLKSSPTYGHFTDLSNIKDFACFLEEIWKKNQGASYAHAQPRDGQWYHVSDSRVTTVTEARVLKSQAYMLFYERLPFKIHSNVDN